LGVSVKEAAVLDAVLAVNRDGGTPLRPERLRDGAWRLRAPVEAYVDFEFLQDLADDFTAFPRKGGQALIFQIGCGTYRDGQWRFLQFTVDHLSLDAVGRMLVAWLSFLAALWSDAASVRNAASRVHWSPAAAS